MYREYIRRAFQSADDNKITIGALVLEPLVIGAGGMLFVDPLYQRLLIDECRNRKIPVIFDEIFVGMYRLGVDSTRRLLKVNPDIACYAKILTGGTVPLAVTLATQDVYDTFLSDSKVLKKN